MRGAGSARLSDTGGMQDGLLDGLRVQRSQIRERWAALLHTERANTPLAHPDALVHLLDWTLDEIFRDLAHLASRRRATPQPIGALEHPECPCGRNPLLAYFAAGEQAMREGLVLAQVATPVLSPAERDASLFEIDLVLHHIARREIEAFCGVCQFRQGRALDHEAGEAPQPVDAGIAPPAATAPVPSHP